MDDSYAKNCRESVVLNLSFTKNGQTGATQLSGVSYTPVYLMDHGEDAQTRYEILPIRSAINSGCSRRWSRRSRTPLRISGQRLLRTMTPASKRRCEMAQSNYDITPRACRESS